jgi:L-asparaginase
VARAIFSSKEGHKLQVHKVLDSNVVIIKCFLNQRNGCSGDTCYSFARFILETYGSGNAPTEDWFINLLTKAIQSGLKIVNVTQCSGSVNMGQYETSTAMKEIGVISGKISLLRLLLLS